MDSVRYSDGTKLVNEKDVVYKKDIQKIIDDMLDEDGCIPDTITRYWAEKLKELVNKND